MKTVITYILICVIAFVAVTNALIYLNKRYVNIFKFDFRPKYSADSLNSADTLTIAEEFRTDSLFTEMRNDSLWTKIEQQSTETESEVTGETETQQTKTETTPEVDLPDKPETFTEMQSDSAYIKWRKKTVKLYEKMDAEQVAQVIPKFSDNIARDIIYSMKKKKAAKVLSYLTPETVARLTKVKK